MLLYTLIFCTALVIAGELTQKEKDKLLCYQNTLRRIISNCISPAQRKLTRLRWNKTLEYFAHVYSVHTQIRDITIPDLMSLCWKAKLTPITFEVDQYERIYELLSKVPEHFNEVALQGMPTLFYRLSARDRATQMGCDYAYNRRKVVPAIHILCLYNYP
ncbi:hypothetical protein PHET_11363 [Paragonimus heterotremus]|uniref:SCP domain-containing protein n=1 Tax=Paragonimus heterotremus TaxID=100268 RepID=A0A8J4T8X7_9TREM|nr:hypothetical protein PHET_11363 [Paragonimus heterotremus]